MLTDDLAYAERERFASRVLGRALEPSRTYRQWMARLGERLVAWGSRLQERYAAPSPSQNPVR